LLFGWEVENKIFVFAVCLVKAWYVMASTRCQFWLYSLLLLGTRKRRMGVESGMRMKGIRICHAACGGEEMRREIVV
jgi:hypothetical protein